MTPLEQWRAMAAKESRHVRHRNSGRSGSGKTCPKALSRRLEMQKMRNEGMSLSAIGRKFGVSKAYVCMDLKRLSA